MKVISIDEILTQYIRLSKTHTEPLLSKQQIHDIQTLLSKPRESTDVEYNEQRTHTVVHSSDYNLALKNNTTFYFEEGDTFWHCLCCNNQPLINKLISFLFDKYFVSICLAPAIVFTMISTFWGQVHDHMVYSVLEIIWICLEILYLLLIILCCNRSVFRLVTHEFDFWMKVYYSIGSLVANTIYIRQLQFDYNRQLYINMSSVLITFIVIVFSLFEGYQISWKFKFAFGLVISLLITLQAVRFTVWYEEPEYFVKLGSVNFGLLAYFASCYRVLSLFLWKQTIMAAWTRGKACISIYVTPKVQWIAKRKVGM